jgi:DNA-binding beta-propeller fold protein YncE
VVDLAAPAGAPGGPAAPARGVAVDPVSGIAAVGAGRRLVLVDGRTGRILRRTPLPAPARHVRVPRAGGEVLATAEGAGALVGAPLPEGGAERAPAGAAPFDALRIPEGVVVSDPGAQRLVLVAGGSVVRESPAGDRPGGMARLDDGRVAVVARRDRALALHDPRTLRETDRVPAGVGPTHVATDGRRMYVVDTKGNALLLVEARGGLEVIRRVFLDDAPYGIAHDPVRRRLWVTLTGRNEVVELSAGGRPRPLRRFPTVRQPDAVAVDPGTGRVFVAGRGGLLQLLDPPPQ